MKAKIIYFLIVTGWLTACSETGTEKMDFPEPTQATLQNVVFLAENKTQQTISVFRNGGSGFTFMKTIAATGIRTEAQLPRGKYQFLFAGSYGINTGMNTPVPGVTLFPAMRFTALSNDTDPDYIREGDELYLPEEKADSIYTIEGPTLIRTTLKRAVAQVVLHVKRGWPTVHGEFNPLPYQNDSIVRYFSSIQLDIVNAATAVDANSIPEGQATVSVDFAANTRDSITPEGFAIYSGPFFFPAANEEDVVLKLNLYRSDNSPQPDLSMSRTATVKRNEQIILNAWVTSDWNVIGITADTRPISQETTGEENIWDDHITF